MWHDYDPPKGNDVWWTDWLFAAFVIILSSGAAMLVQPVIARFLCD